MEEGNRNVYVVEKIVKRRFVPRSNQYQVLVKWQGFGSEENTWEPEDVMEEDVPLLMEEFRRREERRRQMEESETESDDDEDNDVGVKRKKKGQGQRKTKRNKKSQDETESESETETGYSAFNKGYEVDKIIGATNIGGRIVFLIKWKGRDEGDWVPVKIANVKAPQHVIRFYEERLTFIASVKEEDEEEEEEQDEGEEGGQDHDSGVDVVL